MKSNLTIAEQIEYYLGKDKFKDAYFKPGFPAAYEIPTAHVTQEEFVSAELSVNPLQPNVTYRFNNLGYRCDYDFSVEQFKGKRLVLCMGCTDTFGMHDFAENIWPGILSSKLTGYEVLNLGIIGASRDTISRILLKIMQVLADEIEYVCVLWPHPGRREFVSKEFTRMITSFDREVIPFEEYWDFIDWKSNNYNIYKNYHLINNVCLNNNVQLFDLEIDRFDKKVPYDYNGIHFALGKNSHLAIANYFEKKIKNLPSLFNQLKNDN